MESINERDMYQMILHILPMHEQFLCFRTSKIYEGRIPKRNYSQLPETHMQSELNSIFNTQKSLKQKKLGTIKLMVY